LLLAKPGFGKLLGMKYGKERIVNFSLSN